MACCSGTSKAGLAALVLGALVLGAALGPPTASASPAEGKDFFRDARAQYEQGDFKRAAGNFATAFAMLPEVGDYALLYAAMAYLQGQMYSEVIPTVQLLYGKYPGSPITRQARGIEVMARLNDDEPGALGALRGYVSDYPDDPEMKFLLAGLLRNHRMFFKESKEFFRELYVEAGPYWAEALAELEPGDLRAEDHLSHGISLIEARDYPAAEAVLRATLKDCPKDLLDDVKGHLAHALFSQRKYSEAAGLYVQLNDLYNAARSFIRTGNQQDFDAMLEQLVRSRDSKGADLMLAYSGELRRQGRTDEALKMLEDVRRKYPRRSEDATWGIGWTHYITGGYAEAARLFGALSRSLRRDKYRYWHARALQRTGKDATRQFGKINGGGFYGVLSSMRISVNSPRATSSPKRMRAGGFRNRKRIDTLVAVGLRDEAADELVRVARKTRVYRSLRSIALRLVELERYREAMLIAMSLPTGMQPVRILYPLAFWPKVNETAKANGMDPFLILSLIREESRYDPEALSPAGAVGLMQLMPYTARTTARSMRVAINGPDALMEAGLNITLGSRYLRGLLGEFKSVPHALAAYNAGGGRVKKWLQQTHYEDHDEFIEDIPFEETRNYVKRIVSTYYHYQRAQYPEFQHGRGIL